ncbi:MAG: YadA-like family protein [Rhodospirillaceae bacterium]
MKKFMGLFAAMCGMFCSNVFAADLLYGVKWNASASKNEIYSLDPDTDTQTLLQSFSFPSGSWIQSRSFSDIKTGNLWLADSGGQYLKYNIASDTLTTVTGSGAGFQTIFAPIPSVRLADGALQDSSGNNIISKSSDGAIHIGTNSLVTVEENGKQSLYATDANSNKINIDVNNGSDLLVNGTSVMGSIRGLADGVKGTTALNAAFSAVPTLSGDREYECGMGFGQYGGKRAVATSCGARLNDQLTANLGVSYMTDGTGSYLLGGLPSVAVRAGISFKFGKSYSSASNQVSGIREEAWNDHKMSELKREMTDANAKADTAEREAKDAKREVAALRSQLAELTQLKKTVAHLATLVKQKRDSATLASLQQ